MKIYGNILILFYCLIEAFAQDTEIIIKSTTNLYQIEGKLYSSNISNKENLKGWIQETEIIVNSGEYKGFLKDDGSFVINIPSGSYILEVISANNVFESVRVEINSKGNFRVRKINHQLSKIIRLPYPLQLRGSAAKFFQYREQWKITDFIFSPIILTMILSLILLVLLPKMMNDSRAMNEIEKLQLSHIGSNDENMDVSNILSKLYIEK